MKMAEMAEIYVNLQKPISSNSSTEYWVRQPAGYMADQNSRFSLKRHTISWKIDVSS